MNGQVKNSKKSPFPIVDAFLLTPKEGSSGSVAICTNTSAPSQIINEVENDVRDNVSVLGSLIVSRDGAERMILNSLTHPTMKYLVLFSEESTTFSPSTNLLLALMKGFDNKRSGNYIKEGKAASAHYPNLSKKILDIFREEIIVLPLFAFKNDYSKKIVEEYLNWLKPKIDRGLYKDLVEINSKKKIYYDSLNKILKKIKTLPKKEKENIELDPKEFQHLQPPKIELGNKKISLKRVPFSVNSVGEKIEVRLNIDGKKYFITGKDDFLILYSIMKFLKKDKNKLSPLEQILLGAEVGRVSTQMENNIKFPSFIKTPKIERGEEILLEGKIDLLPDKKYYYKVGLKDKNKVYVMCLAFDVCEEVFELRSNSPEAMFEWLADKNRFDEYEMDFLHRSDLGNQIIRAAISAKFGYTFMQDFSIIFKTNTDRLPLFVFDGDSFLDVHKKALVNLYTKGITEEHGDSHKGLARTGIILAAYRDTENSLGSMPNFYKQGDQTTREMRKKYKEQLLRFDHDGSYSYGERTRSFFKFDQLEKVLENLKENPSNAIVVQRFDPTVDMTMFVDEKTGETKYTHDPCLTHDILVIKNKKLYSFHIARAHNIVNAYPENIFGLHDAYVEKVSKVLKVEEGDMYMLSSRANILLLTEEQRTKKVIAEPSKPSVEINRSSGPYEIGDETKKPKDLPFVVYKKIKSKSVKKRPRSKILDKIENFDGVNILEKALKYLKNKGVMHNNPVLGEYRPGKDRSQGDYLIFLQANVFGKKVHTTAVFMNHKINSKLDEEIVGYISTQYSKYLKKPLGELSWFYVNPQ